MLSTRGAWLIRAFALWTIYVWVTRLWNIWRDEHDVAFKVVHSLLAAVSVAFAVAALIVVHRAMAKAFTPSDRA